MFSSNNYTLDRVNAGGASLLALTNYWKRYLAFSLQHATMSSPEGTHEFATTDYQCLVPEVLTY